MEELAAIPPTLPQSHPTLSFWQNPPSTLEYHGSNAELPATADIVIIGSGITGACIAYNLLAQNSSQNVLMLEARTACSGATGRNGGHTKAASYRHFPSNVATLGVSEAVKIVKLEYENIKATHAFARTLNITCDSWSGDTVDIIYSAAQWEAAKAGVAQLQAAMPNDTDGAARYELLNEEQARGLFHCKGKDKIYGAVKYEAGSLSAYKFVCGILQLCLDQGMQLHTNTPVQDLSQLDDANWAVGTAKGTVRAKKVVLATNGYTAALLKRFRGSIVPLKGQIAVHRPGSAMPKEGLKTTYSFVYPEGYEYMISRPQGSTNARDIIIGGGGPQYGSTDDTTLNPDVSKYLQETAPRYFGDSWGSDDMEGRIRSEWTGIMGYSPDGFPFVGEVPQQPNLFMSASFQGHGMVLCFLCAKAVVDIMGGSDDGKLNGWFPDAFKISSARLDLQFNGRLHVKAPEVEV